MTTEHDYSHVESDLYASLTFTRYELFWPLHMMKDKLMVHLFKSASGSLIRLTSVLLVTLLGCDSDIDEEVHSPTENVQNIEGDSAPHLEKRTHALVSPELTSTGVSQLVWPFEEVAEWRMSGSGVGES